MTRKCSHCGHNGHNSRTCPHRDRDRGGVKIFGVRLTDGPIRKSASMGNLVAMNVNGGSCNNFTCSSSNLAHDGYLSDGLVQESSSPTARERKKGVPWSEEEHRMFLVGLQKLGKGDWRGIARNFVITRTPTQVASHAQKFFIRQTNMTRRKRRSSLFDIVAEPDSAVATAGVEELSQVPTVDSALENCAKMQMSSVAGASSGNSSQNQDSSAGHAVTETSNQVPPQPNGAHPLYNQAAIPETSHMMFLPTNPMPTQEHESMVSTGNAGEEAVFPQFPAMVPVPCGIPVMMPGFMSPMVPFPVPVWPGFRPNRMEFPPNCNILKPTAKVLTAPLSIDEETGISKLSIGDSPAPIQPSDLSLKLLNRSSSESAFHANPAVSSNSLNSNSNAIHVN